MTPGITKEEYIRELKRYGTSGIATLLKVSEVTVEEGKAGNPSGWPIQWEVVMRSLLENRGSVAA